MTCEGEARNVRLDRVRSNRLFGPQILHSPSEILRKY